MILATLGTSAQVYNANIIVGANFSQLDGDQFAGYNKLGLNLGIAISRKVNGPWSAGFELTYSQKGSKKVLDPDIIEPSLLIAYHYVEVPLLAKYEFRKKFHFYAGPSIGAVVYNKRDDNGIISKEEELNRTELALHMGGSYQLSERWYVDLRHVNSLLSVRDYPLTANSLTWFGRAGWYNRLFTVGLRYDLGN